MFVKDIRERSKEQDVEQKQHQMPVPHRVGRDAQRSDFFSEAILVPDFGALDCKP